MCSCMCAECLVHAVAGVRLREPPGGVRHSFRTQPSPSIATCTPAARAVDACSDRRWFTGVSRYIGSALRAHRLLAAVVTHAAHLDLPGDSALQERFVSACAAMIRMHADTPLPHHSAAVPPHGLQLSPAGRTLSPQRGHRSPDRLPRDAATRAACVSAIRSALRHHSAALLATALSSAQAPAELALARGADDVLTDTPAAPAHASAAEPESTPNRGPASTPATPQPPPTRTPAPLFRMELRTGPPGSGGSLAGAHPAAPDSPRTAAAKAAAAAAAAAAGYGCEPPAQAHSLLHAPASVRGGDGSASTSRVAAAPAPALTVVGAVALCLLVEIKHLHEICVRPAAAAGDSAAAAPLGTPQATALRSPQVPAQAVLQTPALMRRPPVSTPHTTGRALVLTVARSGGSCAQRGSRRGLGEAAVVDLQGGTPRSLQASVPLFRTITDAALAAAAAAFGSVHASWGSGSQLLRLVGLPLNPASVLSLTQTMEFLPLEQEAVLGVFDQWLTHLPSAPGAERPVLGLVPGGVGSPGSTDAAPRMVMHYVPCAALIASVSALSRFPVATATRGLASAAEVWRSMRWVCDLAGRRLLQAPSGSCADSSFTLVPASDCVLACTCVSFELLGAAAESEPLPDDAHPDGAPAPGRRLRLQPLGALLCVLQAAPMAIVQRFDAACALARAASANTTPAAPAWLTASEQAAALLAELPSARAAKAAAGTLLQLLCEISTPSAAQRGHSRGSGHPAAALCLQAMGLCVSVVVAVASLKANAVSRAATAADLASAVDAVDCLADGLKALEVMTVGHASDAGTSHAAAAAGTKSSAAPAAALVHERPPGAHVGPTPALRTWLLALTPAALECVHVQLRHADATGKLLSQEAVTKLADFLCTEKVGLCTLCACLRFAADPSVHAVARDRCQKRIRRDARSTVFVRDARL